MEYKKYGGVLLTRTKNARVKMKIKKKYNKRNNMNVYTFLVMLRLMFHRNFLIVKLCTFTDAKFPRPCFFFFFSSFSSVRMALRYLVQRVHMLSAMKRLVLTFVLELLLSS